ncbi:hypothetical protein [Alkalihalobacillus sp. BA299]|uniref:hypothetical protein n=1 Tax=Alkalihalobacillus sp. BA299 TaxID=2815938 RepID=UPI001ADD2966|nr:hypothetical protein [Alkalihalobacillus sp. BA299]
MATVNKQELINEFTQEKLKHHFDNNNQFLEDYARMFYFYANKFNPLISENYREEFQDMLYESAKTQYYNGYFIAREFIEHEETVIPDEWLSRSEGMLKEQIPSMLFEAGGQDFPEIIRTETSQKLVRWCITKFEDIRGLLQEVFMDITLLGSLRAFLDERDIRGVKTVSNENKELQGILAPYNDIYFIDPQKYLMCLLHNQGSETWEIHLWSSLQLPNTKIGEITLHYLNTNDLSNMSKYLPVYEDTPVEMANYEKVYVNISILELMNEGELNALIETVVKSIEERNGVNQENIALSVSVINRYL